ncbi:NAD-dependent succinate-semialdehyde dehydrogenase [Lichenibacterium dinghuense]|uniref:NAD-dependent succinate-semialdehyde dehydrogenase n=1 Tax=Lichenibacterium dinghuense TaxID=2895977 RepID=UPI001F44A188|nr:NAD-dependent succinate-semialdehyde dehydrogenase [Lichenibacterium sp. 6Y81]
MDAPSGLRDPSLFRTEAYIDGAWTSAEDGATLDVSNPANGERLGTVPVMGTAETRAAVAAAEAAWPAWRALPAPRRADLLLAWHGAMLAAADDLALIMTLEQGKPLAEARGEVAYGAGFVRWFAEEVRRISGSSVPAPTADRRILVLKEPVGVSAAITPWNFPNAMITRKAAPALAAGCPIVIKPSELTPFSALALAALAERVGIPKGVVNVVTGLPQAIGAELTANPAVRKLSFTGSTPVGRLLMRQCADTVKRVSFELGGNAPFIVFDDASLDLAVAGSMASKFRNAGQTCVCANRILVQDGIHDRFVAALAAAVSGLRVGDGREPGVTLGPLINAAGRDKVLAHLDDARSKGARVALGGGGGRGGSFVEPTVLTGATAEMRLAGEETFGPLAPVFRFRHEEEALRLANDTPFGLAAYFYTDDLRRSWRVAERLEAGMVGLNTGSVSMEMAPFGGIKQSGIGREGSSSGIEEYLEMKSFHIGGLD